MGADTLAYYRSRANRYVAILLFLVIGVAIAAFKIQVYVPLGRFQHYGISLFIIGLGFFIQVIWSWRSFSKWDRISHIASGGFICSIATIFYSNPWLDTRMAVQTEATDTMRGVLLLCVSLLSLIVSLIWVKALNEEKKLRMIVPQDEPQEFSN